MSVLQVPLSGKRVVVGVGGGIAAFKAVALTRELGSRGAQVQVVLTPNAARFVGPITFSGLSSRPVVSNLWDPEYRGEVHVELADWAQAMVVAPATANVLARAAHGMADDVLLATLCCADRERCPVLYAPAMHERMWLAPSTRANVKRLEQDGALFVGPTRGQLASGSEGLGRMAEPEVIADHLAFALTASDLAGRRFLVTAGPTIEDLDPVRFLSNRSSGRMGYTLAARAAARGAEVVLVSGPTALAPPLNVQRVEVRSALEMHQAVLERAAGADAVIMAAAVADFRPEQRSHHKLKKADSGLALKLVRNPDILAELGHRRQGCRPLLVGFAMETADMLAEARRKLRDKRADLIVANLANVAFGNDATQAAILDHEKETETTRLSKAELSEQILDRLRTLLEDDPARSRSSKDRSCRTQAIRKPALPAGRNGE
ncbi:MAG: bifunctional phosphopantothenoylcysteine decarboxylase/phosphopantothenate--cysteine ligase CoaBC [Proteobacteria bacterium]|nr:bifunctional phosphopantothenoylcysteine decarboxylase/phosphopantothenate--cysteine ligase CoaBC [Pseudomonadota bacterium]